MIGTLTKRGNLETDMFRENATGTWRQRYGTWIYRARTTKAGQQTAQAGEREAWDGFSLSPSAGTSWGSSLILAFQHLLNAQRKWSIILNKKSQTLHNLPQTYLSGLSLPSPPNTQTLCQQLCTSVTWRYLDLYVLVHTVPCIVLTFFLTVVCQNDTHVY